MAKALSEEAEYSTPSALFMARHHPKSSCIRKCDRNILGQGSVERIVYALEAEAKKVGAEDERYAERLTPEFIELLKSRLARIIEASDGAKETTCYGCRLAQTKDKNKIPLCYTKPCGVSELLVPDVELFISVFFLLKSDVYKRQPLDLLDRAGARDEDLDIFAIMQGHLSELQERKRAKADNLENSDFWA